MVGVGCVWKAKDVAQTLIFQDYKHLNDRTTAERGQCCPKAQKNYSVQEAETIENNFKIYGSFNKCMRERDKADYASSKMNGFWQVCHLLYIFRKG